MSTEESNAKYCFAVPHYNHSNQFARFVDRLASTGIPSIVIDDGSLPPHRDKVIELIDNNPQFHFAAHTVNRGKGAAVMTACYLARQLGYTHIIQIDADGQHEPSDAYKLIAISRQHAQAIVSGYPVFDESAPKVRLYGRKVSTVFAAIETVSLQVRDALCGFRIYPLDTMDVLVDTYHIGPRMDFDTDIIVKSCWSGFPILFVDTRVAYQDNGTSHFHYLRDNWRLIKLHCRLLPSMLYRVPARYLRAISRSGSRATGNRQR